MKGGEETVALIRENRGAAQFVRTDIAEEAQVEAMVAAAVKAYGKLDGAFNNAAIPQTSRTLHEIKSADFQRALTVNVTGTFYCMKHEIPAMLKAGGGAIVNTASSAGLVAFPMAAEYITSKHAVVGLTKAGALDYAAQNIRINAILPGATRTPMMEGAIAGDLQLEKYLLDMHPVGRMAQPFEIGAVAVFLLSDHASFITGSAIVCDGGHTMK